MERNAVYEYLCSFAVCLGFLFAGIASTFVPVGFIILVGLVGALMFGAKAGGAYQREAE